MAATTTDEFRKMASMIREEDLEALEGLRRKLQEECDQARADGRVYLMQQYIRLVAVVSPEIDRVQRRFKREALAEMRRAHKELKAQHAAQNES